MRFLMAGLVLGCALLAAQEPQTPRFRVAVDAVRIDAVVTDKDGHVVRDLGADDFELLQDGKAQRITFAQFVPVAGGAAPAPAAATPAPLDSRNVVGAPPPLAAGILRRENIQRTIALVVDDLGMSIESLYSVKRGLHQFIDREVQPGDLVALVRTGGSIAGLQPFTTDRRVLHAAVDNLKWNAFSRSAVEAFAAINQSMVLDSHASFAPDDFQALDSFRSKVSAAGTLGALNLVIQGAKSLPGRKAILFVSEGFVILETNRNVLGNPGDPATKDPDPRVRGPLDRAIDQATRAGVVIYAIDARGLQSGHLLASDNLAVPTPGLDFDTTVRQRQQDRFESRRDTQESMAYLAEQTGGFAVLNNNDVGAGLATALQDVRDYYVLGYTPDARTFAGKGKAPEYHKISVRVKRPGLKVRTRKEFLGVSDVDGAEATAARAQQLVNAAISPFSATDIALRATTLPGYAAERGLFVRALLHIDASALTFAKGDDGRATASADVLGMVFDRDGTEVAHLSTGFAAALTNDAAQDALRDGLAYTLRIPIARPGPYQARFAVRDRASGKVGSAGEFFELPDIADGAFALSGIVLRSERDITAASDEGIVISPSQAVRRYAGGTRLQYACDVYNATGPVQLAISVWRGSERVLNAPVDTLTPPSAQARRFVAGGAFRLGEDLPRGSYVLQVAATTAADKGGQVERAIQRMDFEVK